MKIYLVNHTFDYACTHIAKLFVERPQVQVVGDDFTAPAIEHIVSRVLFFAGKRVVLTTVQIADKTHYSAEETVTSDDVGELKRAVIRGIFDCLAFVTGYRPEWGILVGVRPTKLVSSMLNGGLDESAIAERLSKQYYLKPAKIALLLEICRVEQSLLESNHENGFSIYVGIPFCPSRCVYCSFISQVSARGSADVARYVDALIAELYSKRHDFANRPVDALYIGGGTPAILNGEQINRLFAALCDCYQLDKVREITFEAGRPELIDEALLSALRDNGVGRICVNPQTMHDETLRRIGRQHSVADIERALNLVKNYDFDAVNVDIIAGLAGETIDMFRQTVRRILECRPENITVHCLAIKRASKLAEDSRRDNMTAADVVRRQLGDAARLLGAQGYRPYYMYRQKNMLANLENVGYALNGKASFYNVAIIEERQSIVAFGAGATSKIVQRDGSIKRYHNPKDIKTYISRHS
ncbi:MAG: coproporphyrinogen dehydrogenase HemZ [Clostridiales bacterium]|nr:MAG: coproporphyrinogen dehydrogenase HemZ [Clostridiales bacterium]